MEKQVLITGGAGFIGARVADEMLRHGYRVRILDNLSPQIHGASRRRPQYLDREAELIIGNIRDSSLLKRALEDVEIVYHFAAMVGVGQSMYEVGRYVETNDLGTAVLLEALIAKPVERLVVASSMSIYGEGMYLAPDGSITVGTERSIGQLKSKDWEVRGPKGEALVPIPTPESKVPSLPSVYALSKYCQERLCLTIGRAYNIPTVALRFFNVYGKYQALSNPYTGVLAIFASRFLNGKSPLINEDGRQRRDFVSVHDVAQACRLALEVPEASGHVFNVGSGRNYTILEIAERMAWVLGKPRILPEVTGRYRMGDIRHCFSDITLARQILGYEPHVTLEAGMVELAEWLEGQVAFDRVAEAQTELLTRGLAI
jgi:dTDP-L-rhamnose 4-epimerase